uniref:Putative redox-sensing transcriptional repressor n=1 Tax=termite gut metagenome TaxID=433724 RepID=S0DFK5_9ZZZZ
MSNQVVAGSDLTPQMFARLPGYYNYLRDLRVNQDEYVSAGAIAREFGFNEVQVRKDLAAVSTTPGTPRKGFLVNDLLTSIGQQLGYNNDDEAVLIGVGKLGSALLAYRGFGKHGVHIVAAFDTDPTITGTQVANKTIRPLDDLPALCQRMSLRIGIIAVPSASAQNVCTLLVDNGIRAIWNFAPVHLRVPDGVLVQNENLPAQLARLSRLLANR